MASIQNFFKAPTIAQRDEIEWLCKKGMSSNYFTCYVEAPIQGITALVFTCIDVPIAPIKGLGKACICLFQCSFKDAGLEFVAGLEIGIRSVFQIAILIGTVAAGILFPYCVYAALQRLNATKLDRSDEVIEVANKLTVDQQPSQIEDIENSKNNIEIGSDEDSDEDNTNLVEQLQEENLQMTQRIEQLEKEIVENSSPKATPVDKKTTCGQWFVKGGIGLFSAAVGWQAGAIVMAWAPKLILDSAIANEGWMIGGLLTGPAIVKAAGPIIGLAAGGAGFLAAAATAALIYSLIQAIQQCVNTEQDAIGQHVTAQ